MRKIITVFASVITLVTLMAIPVFAAAGDFTSDINNPTVGLTISLNPTEQFDFDVEVIIGQMSYRLGPTYSGDTSYSFDTVIEPGSYDVTVICPKDLGKRYSFKGPDHVEIDESITLSYDVIDNGEDTVNCDEEEGDGNKGADMSEGLFYAQPERIDFGEGDEPTGKIHLECEYCAAIKEVTYRLSGSEKAYDIVLTRDSGFVTDAELPVGNYKETTAIDVELDEDVLYTDGISFTWQHNENPSFWGAYYEIKEDETVNVNDLAVMMVLKGEVAKADANVLFAPKYQEAYDKAVKENRDELIESAGVTLENIEEPTIPELKPVIETVIEEPEEDRSNGVWSIIIIIAGALIIVGGVIFIIIRRRPR